VGNVCVKHIGGALYTAKKCGKHDQQLSWNKHGPVGATDPQGPAGRRVHRARWAGRGRRARFRRRSLAERLCAATAQLPPNS
jgi:hypothetical protein